MYLSPLHETVSRFSTDLWNDSCAVSELEYAIPHGAVGATTNPVIVTRVLEKEMDLWTERIDEIIEENSEGSEIDMTWQLIQEMGLKGAKILEPIFEREGKKKGRISMQTNPKNFQNVKLMVEQAVYFDSLAPNIQVKIPATRSGIVAIEEATARGVNVNATVCFSVSQSITVAEAVERGLNRREQAGEDISTMSPVCTIMVGRVDDWIKVVAKREDVILDPGFLEWPGVAVMKHAYGIYEERGYRARLLVAAFRNHFHWSQFIGGDVVLTIPYAWQLRYNASDVEVRERMQDPVREEILQTLLAKFPEFRKAYDADGMTVEEFDSYGATRRTLRGFIQGYENLLGTVRNRMVPDPD